jgi:hypothetical protein
MVAKAVAFTLKVFMKRWHAVFIESWGYLYIRFKVKLRDEKDQKHN